MAINHSETSTKPLLSTLDHDRNASAMRYVYPVVSRRAGGVSIGINLNVNNACNWACIYCQVPNLTRGGPPPVEVGVLSREFSQLLDDVLLGDFLVNRVPDGMRSLADVAFSGNGEPTASEQFLPAVEAIISIMAQRGLSGLPIRVITNGSLVHRFAVREALSRIGARGGEAWFKIDRATATGMRLVNQTAESLAQVERNLITASSLIPVWVQTCWFGVDGLPPSAAEIEAYVSFLSRFSKVISGVHLYGIARPSLQPDGRRLSRLPVELLESLAGRLNGIGVTASVSE